MSYASESSAYDDSGFYERGYILPRTGGTGVSPFIAAGLLAVAIAAGAFLLLNRKRRGGEVPPPSKRRPRNQ